MPEQALHVAGLTVRYRGGLRAAVDGIDLTAAPGEVVGLIGPNGSGKTTLLRSVAGHLSHGGTVRVFGHRAGSARARRLTAHAADPPLIPSELSGVEWLSYLASRMTPHPRERSRLVSAALELGNISTFAQTRAGRLSNGMRQQLALAATAMCGTGIMLLDETLGSMDPLVLRDLLPRVLEMAQSGRVIIIASHDLRVVEQLATRIVVIYRGSIVAEDATARILNKRIGEVTLDPGYVKMLPHLSRILPGITPTGCGFTVRLASERGMEHVLSVCRDQRLVVRSSRIRYEALEDVLVRAVSANGGLT